MTSDGRHTGGVTELAGVVVANRYRILSWIGDGATGTVWRAEHLALGRPCALKVLKDTGGADSQLAIRFRREARAASRLDHPNIVYISDFGRMEDGRLYLVMEYIAGPSLRDVLRQGVMPRGRALQVLRQIAVALQAAHEAGVVHRDIKPENIVIQPEEDGVGTVKVLDFSLAKIYDGAALSHLTAKGDLFGTPAYMSPEQVRSEPVRPQTDLYAFGVLAFELLTGRLPFEKPSIPAMMLAHREEPPPAPSSRLPAGARPLPEPLEHLVLSCLAKDPADRPARALDVVKQLDAIWQTERAPTTSYAIVAPPSSELAVSPDGASLRTSRRLWAQDQAVRTAANLSGLLRTHDVPPTLTHLLRRIEVLEGQLAHLDNEQAILTSQHREARSIERDHLARLRYALAELSYERGALTEHGDATAGQLDDLDYQIAELERVLGESLTESEQAEEQSRFSLQDCKSRQATLSQSLREAARELALVLSAHPALLPESPEIRTEFEDLTALLRLAEEL